MRNLRGIQYAQWRPPAQYQNRPVTAAAWDLANDAVVCAVGPAENDAVIQLIRVKTNSNSKSYEDTLIASWEAPSPSPDLACDKVVSLHYFGDNLTACLVLAGGDIVVVREDPQPGEGQIEIMGSVDAGIAAARWSPDEELLAITTKEDTIIWMSRSFDGVADTTMTQEDMKASNHVSVGWGKKETQFQGRGAKALRDPTMPEKIDEGVLSPMDDSSATISWRGDGAYLAISKIESASRRIIRVYSREGELDSVSEPVDGLEGALSWRPLGNLIAGIQRLEERIDVVFFERNGLRHGEFSLRLTQEQRQLPNQHIKLAWNSDSTLLAVVMADCTQLWTMGNYHWYLKQEIRNHHAPLVSTNPVAWHPEKPLRFLSIAEDTIDLAEYIFTTARGTLAPPHDFGVLAVIDGQNLMVTPFRVANVPPPMGHHEVTIQSNAIDVSINADASLLAVLHQEGISVFDLDGTKRVAPTPTLAGQFTFESASKTTIYQQITFSGKNEVLALGRSETGPVIQGYHLTEVPGEIKEKALENNSKSSVSILSSFVEDGIMHPYVQTNSGDLHSLAFGDASLSSCHFSKQLPWVDIIPFGGGRIAFGLSSNGHLFANTRLLVRNCTSFLVTPAHLIFTTTTHLLKFVHIAEVHDLEIPPDDPEIDERCRSIERGARLVIAMPTSLSLILQMPRGNLETIFPRAMVLAGIRKLIDEKNYRKAFTHCRTQRVDMNILYDHAPEQFLSSVALFIDQVKKITYIDLFLSSLREEDVTQTMYKETRVVPQKGNTLPTSNGANVVNPVAPQAPLDITANKVSKVNKICDAFLEVLKTRTATNLQNIITSNVCKNPPALDDGLLVVAQLMKEDEALADKAVEHICFLADVNRLYENALGLYDLDLALLVAQQSQKDPREYLPFMQNLQQMPELRRKYSIDDYLSRHTKALNHLHELNAFEELQKYTQKHALYKAALAIYRYNPEPLAVITALYAEYLESKSSYKEAALAYESLHNYAKATSCYLASGPSQWRETLFCALTGGADGSPMSGSALTELANTLYDALIESKDYYAAATIQLDYLSSLETALKAFCKGYFFADALHLLALKARPDLLESVIDPGLGDALASSTELLADCKAQLLAQVPRIRELREKALADPLAFYEGERGGDGELPDDVSVAASSRVSTNRSLFTRYTGNGSVGTVGTGVSRATSKNRRREERKRARGKKGSVYEEEYLVASVGRLMARVEGSREEVERLVVGLVRRGMWERARAIEAGMAEVVGLCRACVGEVFGASENELGNGNGQGPVEGPGADAREYRPVGGDAVYAESLQAAGRKKEAPHISDFEKLSLLGV
ncbi:hypothetical protein DSL72_001088 [Monilinia vaccinii-corymbosi]|uniref:Elongator complex protein 1 n=1 Tax=Monilinia vaccinii-corymbosi TaxID=61207 RepID=A0A8A3P7A3_9HELO|nr:hypothetical protein DSL72_001088 [Monilinia vaccinii-corymbosi]